MPSTSAPGQQQQALTPPVPAPSPSAVTVSTTSSDGTSATSISTTPPEPLILTANPPDSHVLVIKLNRPRVLNALSTALVDLLLSALKSADADPDIGAIVITGNEKAFAAGADIKELASLSFPSIYIQDYLRGVSEGIPSFKKPVIAAVNGHALGGGFELALACDTIFASTNAQFGLPEVKLGTIPGAGGTQRLVRAIGKAKAMHMILTGDTMSSTEALNAGLIAKVYPPEQLLDAAINADSLAKTMASYSRPIVAMAKEAVLQADQLSLSDGIRLERSLYYSTFTTADFTEGTTAFLQKRTPSWKNA
ncbi:hypothetical protein Clacol_007594 [Clathrus columnatus]|uniref:Enoyl-CoA hydratase n=1 Tax=Clathrus columnatus TaxID=1419009 RepID=A0AAV5AHW4_9AGAM|nr:hypothetical protein Clacol_007594 [Clathrus columnatus]